jgi:hypothetical protein
MKIFRAIGFGLALIIVRVAMPEVFRALEETLLTFLNFFGTVLAFGVETFDSGFSTLNQKSLIYPAAVNLVP